MHEYTFKAIPFSFARRVTSAFFRFESLFMYLLLMLNIVTEFCALQGLFVVRTEDISRSNCIVHPQGVSFLLNGKGIDKRVNISMESGPQLPTNVTALLNLGANLLQAIGCFGVT